MGGLILLGLAQATLNFWFAVMAQCSLLLSAARDSSEERHLGASARSIWTTRPARGAF
jgi:hypothetical protein